MATEIQLAGFTFTADEWALLDEATRAELLPEGAVEDREESSEDWAEIEW